MTERTPPAWLQAGSYPAEDDRRLLATIFSDSEGIILSTDLAVTQRGAGANMSVDVAGGRCVIKGDFSSVEGSYFMENRGVTNLVISASDPTNPRIDRIIAEVLNAEYSGASNLWRLRAMTGTPAGSPSAPALPTNAISLATVSVAALASSVVNANITDARTRAWIGTGTVICTSSTRPASPFEGMEIYETDTDQTHIYNGSTWVTTGRIGAYTAFTPIITQSVTVTKSTSYSSYTKIGRTVIWNFDFSFTSGGSASQVLAMTLPLVAVSISSVQGNFAYFDSGNTNFTGSVVPNSTTLVNFVSDGSNNNFGIAPVVTVASGDRIYGHITYEAAA